MRTTYLNVTMEEALKLWNETAVVRQAIDRCEGQYDGTVSKSDLEACSYIDEDERGRAYIAVNDGEVEYGAFLLSKDDAGNCTLQQMTRADGG